MFAMAITSWRLQRKDHLTKEAYTIGPNNNDFEGHRPFIGFKSTSSYLLWFLSTKITHMSSVVVLCLLGYIEMFSSILTSTGLEINIHLLPFIILLVTVPVNWVLYEAYIGSKDSHSFAHACLSSVSACRSVKGHSKGRRSKARKTLSFPFQVPSP